MTSAPAEAQRPVASDEDPRVLAGGVVHALYRVVKGSFLHDDGNQALQPLYEGLIDAVSAFCLRARTDSASVLFASNSVFVNRQMLRASRETYQLALELGTTLLPCRITEVALDPKVTTGEIAEFARAVAEAHRERKVNPKFGEGGWPHLRTRRVLGLGVGEYVPPVTRVARTYAASIMILRSFYGDLRQGKYELSHSLKRVAQKIAGALDDEKRLFISTAATPPADADRAGVAVSSAILATQVAGQLTEDRSVLTNLAMAALLYDAPRVCFANAAAGDIRFERSLNEDEEERLPTMSLITLTAVGKLHPPSITRSVLVYEALALRSEATPPYRGARPPHLLSRILHAARSFAEMRVARGAFAPLSIDDAIDVLTSQATDNTARTIVKLLVGILGVFPTGTLVELSSGELAVVTASPKLPIDFARPSVRILYDSSARLLDQPIDVDLANQGRGAEARVIRKAIDATDQQMKQMRAYVMNLNVRKEEPSPARTAVTTPPPGMLSVPRSNAKLAPKLSSAAQPAVSAPPPSTDGRSSQPPETPRPPSSAPASDSSRPASVAHARVSNAGSIAISTRSPVVSEVGEASRRTPTLRPQMTRRWDPRAEDEPLAAPPPSPITAPRAARAPTPAPRSAVSTPNVAAQPAPPSPLHEKTPVSGAMLRRDLPNSTRQVNWDTFGRERVSTKPPLRRATPPASQSAADDILAAYLSEVETMSSSSSGRDITHPISRGSGGLRWGEPRSSHGEHRASSSSDPRSSQGDAHASQGGAPFSVRRGEPPSSANGRGGETQAPASGEVESNRKTAPPPEPIAAQIAEPETPSPNSVAGPTSGRAKAGNQGWGAPRRDRK
ncbi:MAG: hypothetical protein U0414_32270 [Polyangiaceae bacterium]